MILQLTEKSFIKFKKTIFQKCEALSLCSLSLSLFTFSLAQLLPSQPQPPPATPSHSGLYSLLSFSTLVLSHSKQHPPLEISCTENAIEA